MGLVYHLLEFILCGPGRRVISFGAPTDRPTDIINRCDSPTLGYGCFQTSTQYQFGTPTNILRHVKGTLKNLSAREQKGGRQEYRVKFSWLTEARKSPRRADHR